jgi:molybdopterin-containing oxidoreductase family membrane subunit
MMYYTPTLAEIAITLGTFVLVLLIMTILSKLFPVVPIWEIKEELDDEK